MENSEFLLLFGLSAVERNICNLVTILPGIEELTRRHEANAVELYHSYFAATAAKVNKRKDEECELSKLK